jgi:hypothetical protein
MDDKLKMRMFYAACGFVLIVLLYCFFCFFQKPQLDMTTPLLGLAMLLVGYYWGTSKGSSDKSEIIDKQLQDAAGVENKKEQNR